MKNPAWRLIKDGAGDGRLNMAIDRAILTASDRGQAPATLRLYGWEKPTLSIGYSQNELMDVDRRQCERRNIPIVRSLPEGELCYINMNSLIALLLLYLTLGFLEIWEELFAPYRKRLFFLWKKPVLTSLKWLEKRKKRHGGARIVLRPVSRPPIIGKLG